VSQPKGQETRYREWEEKGKGARGQLAAWMSVKELGLKLGLTMEPTQGQRSNKTRSVPETKTNNSGQFY
jgi:hypothetical protein